ncbi:MAG: IS21 family transposase, partial [Bacilli bacterium]|nr:IS21 family transposase [Bacilli bacterium]
MRLKEKVSNLRKDLAIMKQVDIRPNYKALADKHGLDQRTVKKYDKGYEGKSKIRNKKSRLDKYKEEIKLKFDTTTAKTSSIYRFFGAKYGDIGSYGNFRYYCIKNNLVKEKKSNIAHPRYETPVGEQLQFDWVEDLKLISKHGEVFHFNVFSAILGYSRLHCFIYSKYKTRIDVER